MRKRFNLTQLLQRTGGNYILIVISVVQLIALLGAIPGFVSIWLNIEINEGLTRLLTRLPVMGILTYLAVLGAIAQLTQTARKRLDAWAKGEMPSDPNEELTAWREITRLTSNYAIITVLLSLILIILPAFFIILLGREAVDAPLDPTLLNPLTASYILLGGLASIMGIVILGALLIERFMLPARQALLPRTFEAQLSGRAGALLGTKFQVLTLGLSFIVIALIGSVGYQQAIRILYYEISSADAATNLRNQILLLSVFLFALGAAYSYYATRSVSTPIREMIETFQKIEQGDLSQRVPVSATDELAALATLFNRMVSRLDNLQSTLEQQVAQRTKQLAASNEVARVASSILDPDELLAKVIHLFTDQFNYYFAAIYLIDPTEKWAELKEATGEAGKVLKQNRHRLDLSGKSMVATCIRERSPRIAQNTAEEKQRLDNPLLPYTRSEIALPLIVGDRVLGALNVQSTKLADFDIQVVETMQTMASQVAIALENARLFQEAQQRIEELRSIQKQYLLEGWSSGLSILRENLEYEIGEETGPNAQKVEIPISLRDQVIGQISLEKDREWTPEQQSFIDAVAAQAAIALENARLVAESRQIAIRERMLAEINSRIWAAANIDGVLQTVVKELGRRLDASRATIELSLDEDQNRAPSSS
ncbi:MAG TPA: GAF domain-containing protein [Anaerolineales bacterium]|nr:GAF domain-containing protein [Anaerolineales bacterium]